MNFASREAQAIALLAAAALLTFPVSANALDPGDLLISELMPNPNAVSDSLGEWFEVFNPTSMPIDLRGLLISDDGLDSHTINAVSPVEIQPGEYFVLGRNGDSGTNGGYTADYVYSGFVLGNSGDEIRIFEGLTEIASLAYPGGFAISGISQELLVQSSSPSTTDYGLTPFVYGDGDRGTPGAPGSVSLDFEPPAAVPIGALLAPALTIAFLVTGARGLQRTR